jgi:hypothetical protein
VKRDSTSVTNPLVAAFGPDKQEWKESGNYFSAGELREMERAFVDLTITACPETVLSAD